MSDAPKQIVTNCPLCREKGLHIVSNNGFESQQCINCGMATSDKFLGTMEENEFIKKMPEQTKQFVKEMNGRVWIPTVMTLPHGTIYPVANPENNTLAWAFAEMVDIEESEKENYPIPGKEGEFFTKRYETEEPTIFDSFLYALAHLNELAKMEQQEQEKESKVKDIKLPKLKKG
tara:strand:- start:126 stop:650 length:525 start_codon:yes stop_codon:yes gene_type:complete